MAQIQIKQIKSKIGTKPKHRGTLRALGLTRISRVRIHEDNDVIRGMIARVPHLIEVTEYDPNSETGKMAKPIPSKSAARQLKSATKASPEPSSKKSKDKK